MAVTIFNDNLTATISERGAELTSLQKSGKEFMWEGNPYYWGKHAPVLFPIVGTLKNNRYVTGGRAYEMARHGFARDNDFTVTEQTDSSVTFVLKENEGTLAAYPFKFELKIHYHLEGTGLQVIFEVKNTGGQPMPYSLGAHPAFALDSGIENYSLFFGNDEKITYHHLTNDQVSAQTSVLLLEEHCLQLSTELFENDALVIKSLNSRTVTLAKDKQPVIRVDFADFPNLGLWKKPEAPFLCIEPWQGYADLVERESDTIEQKEGVRLLDIDNSHLYKLVITPGV